jgi:hypothetical protein
MTAAVVRITTDERQRMTLLGLVGHIGLEERLYIHRDRLHVVSG